MKKIITYGTYDLFHEGHRRILQRAKKLGDYLIVGVTTDNYDQSRGKLNVQQNLRERMKNVEESGFADEVIIEEFEGQKIIDIQKYQVDVFAIGSDWLGKFDYLESYCDVVYLERTKGVSSTEIRSSANGILRIGIVGAGRIANRFVQESKYVSAVNIEGVFGRSAPKLHDFCHEHELSFYETKFDKFIEKVDAVYIATPHSSHYSYASLALRSKKHVLCEKPLCLTARQARELYSLALENKCVLLEAIKTAYSPGFERMISLARSGVVGQVVNVDATFTKLVSGNTRELDKAQVGGSVAELASYPLLALVKILGANYKSVDVFSVAYPHMEVDGFTKFSLIYDGAIGTAKVGLGVKSEGDLIISGTKGYIYVPAPWWKTEYFEVRFEDQSLNQKYFCKFEGDGLRYELSDFVSMINKGLFHNYKYTTAESLMVAELLEEILTKVDKCLS